MHYVALGRSLAACRAYEKSPNNVRRDLLTTAKDAYQTWASDLNNGRYRYVPTWTKELCVHPARAQSLYVFQLSPTVIDYDLDFVNSAQDAPVRGYLTTRGDLLKHIFLPWQF